MKSYSYKGVITEDADFDTLTDRGIYRINSSKLSGNNAPDLTRGFGSILIVNEEDGPLLLTSQIVIESSNGVIHTRRNTNDGWIDWAKNS